MTRVRAFDGLRWYAFLGVFFCHALPRVASFGGWGVDLFLVLSAYLLGSRLLDEHARTGLVDVAGFYGRRVRRIWPLYFVVLGVALFFAQFSDRAFLLPTALFGANFAVMVLRRMPTLLIGPMWSTSLEEQFYAVVPWCAREREGLRRLGWILLVTGLLGRWVCCYPGDTPLRMHFAQYTVFRWDGLGVGLLLAQARLPAPSARTAPAWLLGGFVGMAGAICWLPMPWVVLGVALGAGMLVHGARGPDSFLGGAVGASLGERSYGLYLLHGPMLLVWQARLGAYGWPVALACTVGLAAVSYRFLERPILDWRPRGAVQVA